MIIIKIKKENELNKIQRQLIYWTKIPPTKAPAAPPPAAVADQAVVQKVNQF